MKPQTTDGRHERTNRPAYRNARTHLKNESFFNFFSFHFFLLFFQYELHLTQHNQCIKETVSEQLAVRKAKGVKRNILATQLPDTHFRDVTYANKESFAVKQYSLKRHEFSIFLTENKKTLLSIQNTKRRFYESLRRPDFFYSIRARILTVE